MRGTSNIGVLMMAVVLAAGVVGAGEPRLCEMSVGHGQVTFAPLASGDLVLLVAGPEGYRFEERFPAGTSPTFTAIGTEGNLADGSYTYEVRLAPVVSQSVREARRDGVAQPARAEVQSGSFGIAGGSFLDPNQEEPSPDKGDSDNPTED